MIYALRGRTRYPGVIDPKAQGPVSEIDFAGATVEGGLWEYGVPSVGPESAYIGNNVWATNLHGDYPNNAFANLTLPEMNISALAGLDAKLSWWEWIDTEDWYDFFRVFVSTDGGGTFAQVREFSGLAEEWMLYNLSVEGYISDAFVLRFQFTSDHSIIRTGVYLDDSMFWTI